MSEKHHNIFLRDEQGNQLFVICPVWSNCPICQEVPREFYYDSWRTEFESQDTGHVHYQRFTFDLDCLGNENIINCFKEVLNDTIMKTEEPTRSFYLSNSFGLVSYYLPNPQDYLTSCFAFEIWSPSPFPDNSLKENFKKLRDNYYLCECEFNHGNFQSKPGDRLKKRLGLLYSRSVSLLKCDDVSETHLDTFYTSVSAGVTTLRFTPNGFVNSILEQRVKVLRPF